MTYTQLFRILFFLQFQLHDFVFKCKPLEVSSLNRTISWIWWFDGVPLKNKRTEKIGSSCACKEWGNSEREKKESRFNYILKAHSQCAALISYKNVNKTNKKWLKWRWKVFAWLPVIHVLCSVQCLIPKFSKYFFMRSTTSSWWILYAIWVRCQSHQIH